jgi:regulatory protein
MESDQLYEKLLGAGYRFVSYRPRSNKEFRDFLTKKLARWAPEDTNTLDRVLVRLGELGYVDDEAFAVWWVSQRQTFRKKGRRLISHELTAKGVSQGVIDHVFSDSSDVKDEFEVAREVAQKRDVKLEALPEIVRKTKLYEYLSRRGFTSSVIYRVIDERLKKH